MTIKYAMVTTTGAAWKVTFLGETIESSKTFDKLATYTPVQGDMVAFIVDNKGKYLCIGGVSTNTSFVHTRVADNTEIVYITNTGDKYHTCNCKTLKSKIEISKEEAESKGFVPCDICNP